MAFQPPNVQRELANRKILEDLQLKKQLLLKQGVASTLNSSALPVLGSTTPQTESYSMSSLQRTALQTANSQSTGFFISQDSSFGNFILPERLEYLSEFERPNILLEQYVTPPHLSSHMLYTIQAQYGDITGKCVADLGCGCGALGLGAAILDAAFVVGVDIDAEALKIWGGNVEELEVGNIDAILCDVQTIPSSLDKQFDAVIMNPPFGTKHNAGLDVKFLEVAMRLAKSSVYSLHKTSTRTYIIKTAEALGANAEVLAQLHYGLPSTYRFHKRKSVDIEVDFYRFQIK